MIKSRSLPFDLATLKEVILQYPTPFYLYDQGAIVRNAERLYTAFRWVLHSDGKGGGYKNYFAVKALPNPHVLSILKAHDMGVDCSSLAELVLAERCGYRKDSIFFTSNNTPIEEYRKAVELGAWVNIDDIGHIDYMKSHNVMPSLVSFRYNPGAARRGNSIIGKPEEAKFGLTRAQIFEAYPKMQKYGVRHFGLHTMVISNELRARYFIKTAEMLFRLAVELYKRERIRIECISLGGGIGIPYHPQQTAVDYDEISQGIQKLYRHYIERNNLDPIQIVSEYGRVITGPYGYLIATVRHVKHSYKKFVGLDATMANLMRPGMYGAYHHITVIGKESEAARERYDVTGSLCENNDKFAINRQLPTIAVGDIIAIHDVGAHGHAMGFNYNGKLRSAELLYDTSSSVTPIRNAETLKNYFATIDF